MNLSPEKKIAGVLVPLFALRGENDLGIGDLGALREFIDWVAEIGFTLVQLLPINETGADNSPYNAISAMAIEPTTLHLAPDSPQDLTREDFDGLTADVDLNSLRLGAVRYRSVKKLKRHLLEKAFANFSTHASEERQLEFRKFCEEESAWLRDYAFFRALMEKNGDSAAWNRWPAQHQIIEASRTGMNSCWTGSVARLPNHTSKTTRSPKNGGRTGVFRSIAGTECARTIFSGGASAFTVSGAFFTCAGSIMSWDFIASMPSHG